jgi:predicted RNase H-like nuclease (RuvC/YqgF family)
VISNEPIINEDPKIKKVKELQTHVSSLTSQLKQANKAIEFFKKMMNSEDVSKMNFDGLASSLENVQKINPN